MGPRAPDTDSRTGAIEAHLPLVRSIARRYAGRGEPLDDLVQAGTVGLIKAVDNWDPARGRDLAALARPAIEGEIRHHLRDGGSGPHVARGDRELGARLRALRTDLTAQLRRAPSAAELAAEAGVDRAQVERVLAAGEPALALGDGAAERLAADADGGGGTEAAEARVLLEAGWDVLDDRERRLLELRFRDDRSQSEIARELGLSQAHVSRLLKAALERLRAAVTPEDADPTAPAPVSPRAPAAGDARSGRLLLRLPRTLHTGLAEAAAREGVPLNTYISAALATHLADPRAAAAAATRRHRLLVLNAIVIGLAAVAGLALLLTALL